MTSHVAGAPFSRSDTSPLGRWWWTVDRWILAAIGLLIAFGVVLTLAAGPAAADRLGYESFHFVRRQLTVLPVALALLFAVSMLRPLTVRRLAVVVFALGLLLALLAALVGPEVNGARRWLTFAGMSLQPSELLKPAFVVVAAWMFAEQRSRANFPGDVIATALCCLVVGVLLLQPDLGMVVVILAAWCVQFFVAGLPLTWVALVGVIGLFGIATAYFVFPHVASRVDRFLDPASGDSYQVDRSLEAFVNGGLLGRGPGEGVIKVRLPDAHNDFIFAVAGEEFGLIACIVIVALFGVIVLRGIGRMLQESSVFIVLAVTGLLVQFGLQAIIHMASSVHLIPTKGMTLPFISYGGSSLLASAFGIGMVLALTRRRAGPSGVW